MEKIAEFLKNIREWLIYFVLVLINRIADSKKIYELNRQMKDAIFRRDKNTSIRDETCKKFHKLHQDKDGLCPYCGEAIRYKL